MGRQVVAVAKAPKYVIPQQRMVDRRAVLVVGFPLFQLDDGSFLPLLISSEEGAVTDGTAVGGLVWSCLSRPLFKVGVESTRGRGEVTSWRVA